jgi:hypothetical protein
VFANNLKLQTQTGMFAQIYVVIHCGFEFVLNWRTAHISSFAVGKECGDFVCNAYDVD